MHEGMHTVLQGYCTFHLPQQRTIACLPQYLDKMRV